MQAASDAYEATLAPVHTYFVRMAVKTSMYLLPDRATFIASIGETGAAFSSRVCSCMELSSCSLPRPFSTAGSVGWLRRFVEYVMACLNSGFLLMC